MSINKRYVAALALALVLIAAALAAGSLRPKSYSKAFYEAFDTYSNITLYSRDGKKAEASLEAAYNEALHLHRLFDIYNSYPGINNLKTVNDMAGVAPVKVEQPVIELLQLAVTAQRETEGVVDPSMGAVLNLWHNAREQALEAPEQAALPDMGALKQAAELIDISALEIDPEASTVYISKKGVSLDVGAIAKGYGADCLAALLKQRGETSCLIALGGNIVSIGTKPHGKPWVVGVQNPGGEGTAALVDSADSSVVTSGDYQRFFTVNGVNYNHIINVKTLMPGDRYSSVTVVAESSAVADMLSTALFIMDEQKGDALAAKYKAKVCRIYKDGRIVGDDIFQQT